MIQHLDLSEVWKVSFLSAFLLFLTVSEILAVSCFDVN